MRTLSPAFDPVRPLGVPPAPLRKIRGTYRRGNYCERPGLLGTFVADTRGVERVWYAVHPDHVYALITRNRWETWGGNLTTAQWEALRADLPATVEYATV